MKRSTLLIVALGGALAIGCEGDTPLQPVSPSTSNAPRAGSPAIGVLTWNVYVGARIQDLLTLSDPNLIPFEVARLWGGIQATDFAERAEAIAETIAETRPHVIGLQEISIFRLQSPGDFLLGNPVPATDIVLDYLDLLERALDARGASYDVAVVSTNFDVELPMVNFSTGRLDDIRLVDADAILVRSDLSWWNAQKGNFQAVLPIQIGGVVVPKPSGWTSVDFTVKDRAYRLINTHLEAADIAPGVVDPGLAALQAAQAAELLAIAVASPHPVILAGDLNSAADGSTTPTYQEALDAGFVDAWTTGRPRGLGYTSSQDDDLRNAVSTLRHRIDFVLYRDESTVERGHFPGAVHVELVGEDPADKTPSGLWPSDHAGVSAQLRVAPARR